MNRSTLVRDEPAVTRHGPDTTAVALAAAEIGLLCVGGGTAFGFSRLFIGWDHLIPLGLATVSSWALAVLTRRLRLGVAVSALISALAAVLLLTWRFAPDTTAFGLPTPDTALSLLDALRRSFGDFSTLIAPVRPTDGFLVALVVVMWTFTFFADTAAFRYHGPVQAVIPYTSAFIAAGVLARDTLRLGSAIVFLAGMGIYAATQRTLLAGERRWAPGDDGNGLRAMASAALLALVVALGVGTVVGPLLPGDTRAVLDLRSIGRGAGARTVISPFVGVRNLLGPQNDQIVFTVRAAEPTYWRLTSLGQYDRARDIWVSSSTYRDVGRNGLARRAASGPSTVLTQDVTVVGLGGPWLPAAFVPTAIDTATDVGFDPASSSIIARDADVTTGTTYRVRSEIPTLDVTDLGGSRNPDRVEIAYRDVSGVSTLVRETARAVAGDRPTPYLKALALQNWFRDEFTYSTDVDFSDAPDPVAEFLKARTGFCQQFSSTFALMARSVGLPSRVAVGFTPGDLMADTPGGPSYVVRGRHAHAWPEVHIDGVGWVAFEPTPGRGNPQATGYTGVPAQQVEPPAREAPDTIAPTTTAVGDPASPTTQPTLRNPPPTTTSNLPTGRVDTTPDGRGRTSPADSTPPRPWVTIGAVVALLAVTATLLVHRRRRESRLIAGEDGRVALAWHRASADLATIGIRAHDSETPVEFALRVAEADPWQRGTEPEAADPDRPTADLVAAAIAELAVIETARRYGSRAADEQRCERADAAASVIHTAVRSVATAGQRIRQLVG